MTVFCKAWNATGDSMNCSRHATHDAGEDGRFTKCWQHSKEFKRKQRERKEAFRRKQWELRQQEREHAAKVLERERAIITEPLKGLEYDVLRTMWLMRHLDLQEVLSEIVEEKRACRLASQ